MKKKLFTFITVLLPLVTIIIAEIILRAAGYGTDHSTFVQISKELPDHLFLNPKLPEKYFGDIPNRPSVIPDGFLKEKKEKSFRVFVFGGSSTAGWPFIPNVSFSRALKRRLEILYPSVYFEVVNCGISAVNSYTVRDIIDDVIEQKPDLTIFYLGHNEYYGAYGAASTSGAGGSIFLKNLILNLKDYRLVQLVQNVIGSVANLFASDNKQSGTLMSTMIGEQSVPIDSEIFNEGIEQFNSNMQYILNELKESKVNTILCAVTSNLMQEPLDYLSTGKETPALQKYNEAMDDLSGNTEAAKQKFIRAKELDALRFRAPEKINDILSQLAAKNNIPFIKVDSIFEQLSPNGIPGENLFVDHLHPKIEGHEIISEYVYNKIVEEAFIPFSVERKMDEDKLERLLNSNRPFTKVDSIFTELRLKTLLNSFPFTPDKKAAPVMNFKPKDEIEKIAYALYLHKLSWEKAHYKAADFYYSKKEYVKFLKEMYTLIEDKPFDGSAYVYAIDKLMKIKALPLVYPVLKKLHFYYPSEYTTRRLGYVAFRLGDLNNAEKYISMYLTYNSKDANAYYDLAGVYIKKNELYKARAALRSCLNIDKSNKDAARLFNQINNYLERNAK